MALPQLSLLGGRYAVAGDGQARSNEFAMRTQLDAWRGKRLPSWKVTGGINGQ
ncbi:hypothetical protein ACWPKO_26525 (plasmid) [Coraliomargarita sp. W4R53]